jgi:type I restriction enzyme S subunit
MKSVASNLVNLKPNLEWASLPLFDRTGWKRVRFGDVVKQRKEQVNPEADGIERYVAGEHMETENVHIREWGTVGDGTTFTRRCRPGQVLFGKRRAYQRKVAVAEFEAVVSGDIYVFTPKNELQLPELLPFLCLSERFFQHAVGTSAGSLSPRTNWSSLANFEFDIPPLDQQRRIAEILWAVDEAVDTHLGLYRSCETAYSSAIHDYLFNTSNPAIRVGELSNINKSKLAESTDPAFTFHYIDIGTVIAPKKLGDIAEYRFADAPSRARRIVSSGDILLSTVRPNLRAFLRAPIRQSPLIASTGFAVITPKAESICDLLFHAFFSKEFMAHCDSRVTGTSYPSINAKDISDFIVFLPGRTPDRLEASSMLNELEANMIRAEEHMNESTVLLKFLVEHVIPS